MSAPDLSLARLNIIIPEGVTFDGVQEGGPGFGWLLCFTVVDLEASFSVKEDEVDSVKLARLAGGVRRAFTQRAPLVQRAPIAVPELEGHY